jgi:cytochrome c-type biogenesis protein CcsB
MFFSETNSIKIELLNDSFFMNTSFLFLLIAMVFSWIQIVFTGKSQVKTKIFRNNFELIGQVGMMLASISLFLLLSIRWFDSGHFPLSNLYESLIFLSWCFTVIHFLLGYFYRLSPARPFLGAVTSPSALFMNAFATLSLPSEMQYSKPLVPALQSNWLMMHVTVMILSYAALICGSLLSIAFLIIYKTAPKTQILTINENGSFEQIEEQTESFQKLKNFNIEELIKTLDYLSYRVLGLGFPFLTIGILSGAVWANEAWGSYWSWDPKETWALLTWLVFAIYLHTRLSKGWSGEKPAIIASFGFFVVWICYLGVNLMGEGLHSYGWIHT